jgi:predicted DNA binding CopG/RHH family protein
MKKNIAPVISPSFDAEENQILEAFESAELRSSGLNSDALLKYRTYADATFRKDARINIRLSSRDLKNLQKKALEEGIPYQTLISSVLHKYVEGRLQEN